LRAGEADARRLALLDWVESNPVGALWSTEDARWATREARRHGGADFRVTRARLGAQRLAERDERFAELLSRELWPRPAPWLALLGGALAGIFTNYLGATPYLNLLHLPLWSLLLAQLLGYLLMALLAWRGSTAVMRPLLATWHGLWLPRRRRSGPRAAAALTHWLVQSAPLQAARVGLLWHLALLGLNLGLIAGLYLRGLGQEYLAGWQSTWLDAAQVQALVDRLLAPAAWITGLAVPDVAPLRHAAGALPGAPAATWLHLLAATVALVALPRALLVLVAGWRCHSRAKELPGPAVHGAHDLRLRLVDAQGRLAGGPLATDGECLCSPEGDRLLLTVVTDAHAAHAADAADAPTGSLWRRGFRGFRGLQRLSGFDAPPSWHLSLDAARLPASAPGWPAQRRQLRALDALWPPAKRAAWQRLLTAWEEPLQEREQQAQALLADALLDMLRMRVPLPAQSEPLATLRLALRRRVGTLSDALHALYGGTDAPRPPLVLTGALPHRVERPLPTARNSVLGGMASGAAAGLGADAASAGLTLGAGAALGAVAGGLMAAGATDWLNRRQDRREARVEPDPDSAAPLLAAALLACWQRELGLGLPDGVLLPATMDCAWSTALRGEDPSSALQQHFATVCEVLLRQADQELVQGSPATP
jgi:hypothetical protein